MSEIEIKKNRKYTLTERNRHGAVLSKQKVKTNAIVVAGRGYTVHFTYDNDGKADTLPMRTFQRLAAK